MGVSRYLKEKKTTGCKSSGCNRPAMKNIPGIRRWPKEYLPRIFQRERVDRIIDVTPEEAEDMARRLADEEGIFAGISSGGAVSACVAVIRRTGKTP